MPSKTNSTNVMPGLVRPSPDGERIELHCPVSMPRAGSFLWNRRMLLQVNCRGFVVARHMQPEPSRYSYAPVLEQQTFMQPEQPYYSHHPGRFVYLRDDGDGSVSSVPHEPARQPAESFVFSVGRGDIEWRVSRNGIASRLRVSLPADDVVEMWTFEIENRGERQRDLSVYPCFTIGYMSWMYQGAQYREDLGGVVASCVTPYQKLADFERVLALKDRTFMLPDREPDAWETRREVFEGEGGPQHPDALREERLANGTAEYDSPVAALQYRVSLAPGESRQFRFLFGPAHDDGEIAAIRSRYFGNPTGWAEARQASDDFLRGGAGCVRIATPDAAFDNFVNCWLNRQVYYHGTSNRLTTDPQTRNYLQDAMGMAYIDPCVTRDMLLRALGQQQVDGRMPDGILLTDGAELKYINQVPHTDHCVWLAVCLDAYLAETADYALLDTSVADRAGRASTVFERVTAAMLSLVANLDERGLSLIGEGDWCDPMNMVGPAGRGVSGWLSMATVFALRTWSGVCRQCGQDETAAGMASAAERVSAAVQAHLWDGDWFARGITDEGTVFGIEADAEGSIYLNPQSWSVLAGIATPEQSQRLVDSAVARLDTPFGMQMLGPAYTKLRADIGRLTQKYPGTAENGSIYNHAAMFFLRALYRLRMTDAAWSQLHKAIPPLDGGNLLQRGQLPVFVPNYYRGSAGPAAGYAMGRSSQLFNTGAASWMYRCIVEDLFGLRGEPEGLRVAPQLPAEWQRAAVTRHFRGATYAVEFVRDAAAGDVRIVVDGVASPDDLIRPAGTGQTCVVRVSLPGKA